MQMLSTRGAAAVSPSMAILRGLAPDGGLYVPAEFPSFTIEEIEALAPMGYQQRALAVLSRFLPDFTKEELESAISGAYGTGFDTESIAPMVKVGGTLVYSTCSILPQENEAQIRAFLERHPEYAVMPMAAELPEALAQQEGEFGLQMLAHRDGTDGFYVCRMKRVKV